MQRRSLTSLVVIGTAAVVGLSACGNSTGADKAGSTTSAPAAASSDTVTAIPAIAIAAGTQTSVDLDAGLLTALTSLKVTPSAFGTATLSGTNIAFPITSGYADIHSDPTAKPGYIQGSLAHEGSGITLTAGSTVVSVTNFTVDPGYSKLYGDLVVGGTTMATQTQLADLDGSPLKVTMANGDVKLDGTIVHLTAGAAMALDGAFKTDGVKAGQVLGVAHIVIPTTGAVQYPTSAIAAALPRISGGGTSVILDSGTFTAIKGLGVAVTGFGTAKMSDTPPTSTGAGTAPVTTGATVTFPITGGAATILSDHTIKPGYVQGVVNHLGSGLTFTAGSKTLTVTDFAVDPGNSVVYATVQGAAKMTVVKLLDLDGTKVQLRMNGSDPVLYGTVAHLSTDAAMALDSTFGTTALKGGEPIGIVSLQATAGK